MMQGFWQAPETLYGMKVFIAPDIPKYVLPEEIMPGLPWPVGFRAEFNQWSIRVLGTTSSIPGGGALVDTANCRVVLSKLHYDEVKRELRVGASFYRCEF